MRQPSTHRLIAFLCLVAFGLGQTLFASMGVRCTDASGTSRIEYACVKASNGACLTPSSDLVAHETDGDHSSDPAGELPCEDEPLGSQISAAQVIPSGVSIDPVLAAVVVAVFWDGWPVEIDQPARSATPEPERDRPPDSLARLRTVILIV